VSTGSPVVRRPEQVPSRPLAPGVTAAEMLNDEHGCRGLHQRRLRIAGDGEVAGTAGGQGEAWYVINGSGVLKAGAAGTAELRSGTAVWLGSSLGYRCQGELEVLVITVRADAREEGPELKITTLESRPVERTGDREFRVLLSEGLSITQFAGLIPPGRAPEHQHTYDEVVHVLAGQGVVHLDGTRTEIGPGTSIYLPPQTPHCLENTGAEPLQVLGVFYPADSPAAKQELSQAGGLGQRPGVDRVVGVHVLDVALGHLAQRLGAVQAGPGELSHGGDLPGGARLAGQAALLDDAQ
jgi:mannose-6-phosphate isomerase-like protein (cupin superfamily)